MIKLKLGIKKKERHRNNGVSIPVHSITELMMSMCLITSDTNVAPLVKVTASGFLYWKE